MGGCIGCIRQRRTTTRSEQNPDPKPHHESRLVAEMKDLRRERRLGRGRGYEVRKGRDSNKAYRQGAAARASGEGGFFPTDAVPPSA